MSIGQGLQTCFNRLKSPTMNGMVSDGYIYESRIIYDDELGTECSAFRDEHF